MSSRERDALNRALRNGGAVPMIGQQQPTQPPIGYHATVESDNWQPLPLVLRMGIDSEGREVFALNQFGGASKRLELVRSMLGNILHRDQDEEDENKMIARAFTIADKVLALESAAKARE